MISPLPRAVSFEMNSTAKRKGAFSSQAVAPGRAAPLLVQAFQIPESFLGVLEFQDLECTNRLRSCLSLCTSHSNPPKSLADTSCRIRSQRQHWSYRKIRHNLSEFETSSAVIITRDTGKQLAEEMTTRETMINPTTEVGS